MSNFEEMFRNNRRLNDKLIKMCVPLFRNFGFNSLFYHHISEDGFGTSFGTHVESFENYFHHQLYLTNPYIRHPDYFRDSLQLVADIRDDNYQKAIDVQTQTFNVSYKVVMIERTEGGCQGFSFSAAQHLPASYIVNHLPMIKCFIQYLKEEGKEIFDKTLNYQLPINEYVKHDFFEKPTHILMQGDEHRKIDFLKQVGILTPTDDIALSPREKQCIRCLLQGKTAAETALLLNLSKRTVEHYIENIKLKTNCFTKLELFEKFKDIEALGLM